MSSYHIIYADADDHTVTSVQPVYADARSGLGATLTTGDVTGAAGQAFISPNYTISQVFFHFDTSVLPAGPHSGALRLVTNTSGVGAPGKIHELREISWASAAATNFIPGADLGAYPLLGSFSVVDTVAGEIVNTEITVTASASYGLFASAERQRLDIAPTVGERPGFKLAEQIGTANDPRLTVIVGDQVTFVAGGAFATGIGSVTPPLPTGIEPDDILLLFMETSSEPVGDIAGWLDAITPVETAAGSATTSTRLTVRWLRYTGVETAPVTGDPGNHIIARVMAFRDCVKTGSPFDVVATSTDETTGTTATFPDVTTTVDGTMLVYGLALPDDSSATLTAGSGGALVGYERLNYATTISGTDGGLGVLIGAKEVAGAVGSSTATLSTGLHKALATLALKPHVNVAPEPPPPLVASSSTAFGPLAGTAGAAVVASAAHAGQFAALAGSGTAVFSEPTISAASSTSFGAITGSASATIGVAAQASASFGALGSTATGAVSVSATASGGAFGAVAGAGTAASVITAASAGTFSSLDGSATATLEGLASSSTAFGPFGGTASASAETVLSVSGGGSFAALAGTSAAQVAVQASGAAAFGVIAGSAAASSAVAAASSGQFGPLAGSASGEADVSALSSGQFAQFEGSGAATSVVAGSASAAFGPLAGTAAASSGTSAVSSTSFGALGGTASGDVEVSALSSGQFAAIAGSGAAAATIGASASGGFGPLAGQITAGASGGLVSFTSFGPLGGTASGTVDVAALGGGAFGLLGGGAAAAVAALAAGNAAFAPLVSNGQVNAAITTGGTAQFGPMAGAGTIAVNDNQAGEPALWLRVVS